MSESVLSKTISLDVLRGRSAERIANTLLVLWCLLPLCITVLAFFFGLDDKYVQAGIYIPNGLVSYHVQLLFRRTFLVLGSATILFVLSQVILNWDKIKSIDALKSQPWLYLLAALLVWSIISTLLSDAPVSQFKGSSYRCDGLYSYFIFASVFCCALVSRNEAGRRVVLAALVAVVDVLCVIMVLEAFRVNPIRLIFQTQYAVVYNNLNHFGYVLCMTGLCTASLYFFGESFKSRIFYLFSFAIQCFALVLNDTFGAYLATIVGLIVIPILWVRSRGRLKLRLFMPLAIFVVLSALSIVGCFKGVAHGNVGKNFLILFTDFNNIVNDDPKSSKAGSGRLRLWLEALSMIPNRPLFGYGPEGLMGAYAAKMGVDRPHNEVIQYAAFLGIPGLLLYLSALVTLARRQLRNLKSLSPTTLTAIVVVIGYFVSSLVGNTMFNTAPYYWMMLGFAAFIPDAKEALLSSSSDEGIALFANSSRVVKALVTVAMIIIVALVITLGFSF